MCIFVVYRFHDDVFNFVQNLNGCIAGWSCFVHTFRLIRIILIILTIWMLSENSLYIIVIYVVITVNYCKCNVIVI